MRTIYVPFAMSNVGPLVALFYAACRRYVLMADDEEKAKKYKTKMLRYRLIGLQLVKEAVASESAPSDATIALAMIMGGESVSCAFTFFVLFWLPCEFYDPMKQRR